MAEIFAVEGVRKRFGEVEALRGVDLVVEGPQVVGILGPNGAGKTTLLDLLEGLAAPSAGAIRLFGAPLDLSRYPRERVGVVLQKEFALDGMRVGEYAELFAAIQGRADGRRRILSQAGLADRADQALSRLSGGEAQRLFIAAAAVHDPDLLFLDEPTAHLDPAGKLEIGRMLRAMAERRTVVMTTHDLREAEAVCDQVVFLLDGVVRASGARQALLEALPDGCERSLEGAFFHFCAARIDARGDRA